MTIGEWIDEYGEDLVEDLARRLGGQRIYIPAEGPLHPEIHAALGDRACDLRESYYGTEDRDPEGAPPYGARSSAASSTMQTPAR